MLKNKLSNNPQTSAQDVFNDINQFKKPVQVYYNGYQFLQRFPSDKPHYGEDVGVYDIDAQIEWIMEDMEAVLGGMRK